jgi:tetratricopeptide (TPR) repeat protein
MTHPARPSGINRIGALIAIATAVLLPIVFVPYTQDFYDTHKWMILMTSVLVFSSLWIIRTIRTGAVSIHWSGTVGALGAMAAVSLTSLLFSGRSFPIDLDAYPQLSLWINTRIEPLISPIGAGTWIGLFLTWAIAGTYIDEKSRTSLRWSLYAVAGFLGLMAIYQFFGLSQVTGLSAIPGLGFLSDGLFTPAGTSVGLMIILAVTLPLLIAEIIERKSREADTRLIASIVMAIALGGGLILTAIRAIPLLIAGMLPYGASWQILMESYKEAGQLIFGVGAQNFIAAFTAGRPMVLNMLPTWGTRYTIASSLFFHIATVYGLLGATALISLFSAIIREKHPPAAAISRWIALLAFILLPPSFPALVFVSFLLLSQSRANNFTASLPQKYARLWYAGAGVLAVLILITAYGLMRVYGAELAFGRSLRALEKRDGTEAYNAQIEAITLNPGIARYHTSYSQTNLALAAALSRTATGSADPGQVKKDRDTATQLVQQAIREAKLGVNLAPANILAWENIAAVYQELTGVAQGADQWTIAAYSQAIRLDPTNPSLRLRLGGAYTGQQKFDRAAEMYAAAIQLKPDYANAYYNLGFVYRETKKYFAAAQAIREALKYVAPGSESAAQGEKELASLRELLTEAEKRALDAPQQAPALSGEAPTPPAAKSIDEPLSPIP